MLSGAIAHPRLPTKDQPLFLSWVEPKPQHILGLFFVCVSFMLCIESFYCADKMTDKLKMLQVLLQRNVKRKYLKVTLSCGWPSSFNSECFFVCLKLKRRLLSNVSTSPPWSNLVMQDSCLVLILSRKWQVRVVLVTLRNCHTIKYCTCTCLSCIAWAEGGDYMVKLWWKPSFQQKHFH